MCLVENAKRSYRTVYTIDLYRGVISFIYKKRSYARVTFVTTSLSYYRLDIFRFLYKPSTTLTLLLPLAPYIEVIAL